LFISNSFSFLLSLFVVIILVVVNVNNNDDENDDDNDDDDDVDLNESIEQIDKFVSFFQLLLSKKYLQIILFLEQCL